MCRQCICGCFVRSCSHQTWVWAWVERLLQPQMGTATLSAGVSLPGPRHDAVASVLNGWQWTPHWTSYCREISAGNWYKGRVAVFIFLLRQHFKAKHGVSPCLTSRQSPASPCPVPPCEHILCTLWLDRFCHLTWTLLCNRHVALMDDSLPSLEPEDNHYSEHHWVTLYTA